MRSDVVHRVGVLASRQTRLAIAPGAISKNILAAIAALIVATALPLKVTAEPVVSFSKQVLPIFQAHCVNCHSTGGIGDISAAVDVTSYKDLRAGGIHGIAVVPFHSDRSPIIRYLKDNWKSNSPNVIKMPPLGPPLSDSDIKIIADWIDQGAKNN
jgi:hypothetical protein